MKRSTFTLTVGIVCAMCTMAIAAVPSQITLQGILWDAGGNPVADASYSVVFKIYDAPTGGNVLWSETQSSVSTTGGVYTVLLGSLTPIPDSTFNGSSRWLGMKVGADPEMSPRQQLVSTGYSFVSSQWTSAGQNLFRLNGNVGIGTSTPAQKLDVTGTAQMTGFKMPTGATNGFVLTSDASGAGTWQAAGAGGPFVNLQAGTPGSQQTGHLNISGTGLFGGNVGIGTTSPGQKLDVAGTAQMTGFKLTTSPTNGFVLTSDGSGVGTWQAPPASGIGGSGTANNVAKFTSSTAIGNSAIFDNGNVGIGTTSPFAKLEVRSSGTPVAIVFGDNTGAGSLNANSTRISISTGGGGGGQYFAIDQATGNVGINTISPTSTLHVAGPVCASAYNCASDVRYKENITSLQNSLQKVLAIRGTSFTYKLKEFPQLSFPKGHQIGFIAQEVREIIPEIVSQDKDGFYSLDYARLTPVLLEAIKDQQNEIGELKDKIKGLENGFKAQVGEMEGLKAQLSELQKLVHTLSAELQSTDDSKMANSEQGSGK